MNETNELTKSEICVLLDSMATFTRGNADNLDAAIDGLSQFMHNWCMDCKATEDGELTFRCKSCEFEGENGTCKIKVFLNAHTDAERASNCTSMGSL